MYPGECNIVTQQTWGVNPLARLGHPEKGVQGGLYFGTFYLATGQAVLLFGSEGWNITPSALAPLEGFHLQSARRMAGMPPTESQNGKWDYPKSAKVLESVGLRTIAEYIRKRRSTAMQFIVDRPIHALCLDAERQRGTAKTANTGGNFRLN